MLRTAIATTFATLLTAATAQAQTKWDLPTGYPVGNFHTVNLQKMADAVKAASGGKLEIVVHPNGSLYKANEIKRAVQTGQVPAGEVLATISATRADNVVGYQRQPYRFDPQVGMVAQVTTRNFQRQAFTSHIAQVGAQVEVLTNALAMQRPGLLVDAALPVIVPVPSGVHIRPGGIVDIIIAEPPAQNTLPTEQTATPRPQL